jgi:nicotinate-nucleotide pyrophosphorylase (carboxylating)
MNLSKVQYLQHIQAALREDIRSGDVTTNALIPEKATATASMNFRESGVVCGLDVARISFEELDRSASIQVLIADGQTVASGMEVMRIAGSARAILTAERVALNYAQRLSGIATLTQRFVQAVAGTKTKIADTRKTTPGSRLFEKYAVRCGGGSNHRFALDDLILIKDNHIALCGGVVEAVRRAREYSGHALKVEVECDTLEQVEQALEAEADIILLDNMMPLELKQAVQRIDGRAVSEASGGVSLQTVRAIAECGVDIISIGALTHSARALDIGLDIKIN